MVIALFSTNVGSESAMEGSVAHLLRSMWPAAVTWLEGAAWLDPLSFIVRKAAHVGAYGVLALLLARALRSGLAMSAVSAMAAAVGVCALVASADELHQSLVATRTASIVDIGIDVAGAVAVLVWFHVRGSEAGRR
jgi:VanZ family protein